MLGTDVSEDLPASFTMESITELALVCVGNFKLLQSSFYSGVMV